MMSLALHGQNLLHKKNGNIGGRGHFEAGQARGGGSMTTQPAEDIPLLTPGISAPLVRYIDLRAARVAINLNSVLRCVMDGKC